MTILQHTIQIGKFTKKPMKLPFCCKICSRKRQANWAVDRIVFGRRQWYPICKACAPQHGVPKTVTGNRMR